MKSATLIIFVASALGARAFPASKRADTPTVDDVSVLNFALTLEHLEDAFYTEGLAKYDAKAFENAGFPSFVRGRFEQVAAHEKSHVAFLSAALGNQATQPCTYKFPFTDPKSFVALGVALESTGSSAYTGAAQFLTSKTSLTAAAAILATEARHASWISSAVTKGSGWSGNFETPLGFNQIFSIASGFITSCPSTNPPLPVQTLPSLVISGAKVGATVKPISTSFSANDTTPLWIAFFSGLDTTFVEIENGSVKIPEALRGTVYAVVSNSGTVASADTIVSGAAVLNFPFNSAGKLV